MNAPSRLPTLTSTAKPSTRPRRVKRGIVAGYIHDISRRHQASERVMPTALPATPVAVAAGEPHKA